MLTAVVSPSPSPTDDSPVAQVAEGANALVTWLLGPGLQIAVIVVLGAVVLAALQRLIRGLTQHVAEGTSLLQRGLRPLGGTEMASTLLKVSPLATARRAQRARTIGSVLRSTVAILVGTIVVFLVLDVLGVNIAPFVASAGIVGVALGFGAQSLVRDFLSGLFMLLEDQYGVGDVVDVGPATGTVEAVALRVTKIRDAQGTLWYVPNGTMTRVGNKTQGWANAVVEVKVDYFADLDEVRGLLVDAAGRVQADPVVGHYLEGAPSVTGIEDLAFDAVTLRVSVRTSPAMQWEVARELRTAVRQALEEAGIPLAGQRDLLAQHLESRAAAAGPGTADASTEVATKGDAPRADADGTDGSTTR
ncbi:mechanosensitive ion channel family protein [Cellulomonas hominis]